jgi:signal transduction histidine kinase
MVMSGPGPAQRPAQGSTEILPPPDSPSRVFSLLYQSVSTELPNQLIAVLGLAQLLEQDESNRLSNEGREYLRRLNAATQRAQFVVRHLADILRACQAAPGGPPTSLAEIAAEAAAELMVFAPRPRIEYDFPQPDLILDHGTASVRQALSLLLKTAVMVPTRDQPPDLRVGGGPVAGGLEISVSDNGPGLSSGDIARLFEPFALRSPGGEPNFQPFLAREIIERCGGRLTVQSAAETGTTYTIFLPSVTAPSGG